MMIQEELPIQKKLEILSDAAKYDVACTSSGVDRKGEKGSLGNASSCGICHSFAADGRCISLLKILYSNECIYDCKYCINRRSNDTLRTSFTPEELCELTMQFYRRNYIEGLFLSSGIRRNPTETMEQIFTVLKRLREVEHFNGYIHIKTIPGAAPELIAAIGFYADRMSTNLELPTAEGLQELAPNKTRSNILKPLRQIQTGIEEVKRNGTRSIARLTGSGQGDLSALLETPADMNAALNLKGVSSAADTAAFALAERTGSYLSTLQGKKPAFVPAGQSTQMIIGATKENDYQVLSVAEALYQKFHLKRVFYSAYVALNEDSSLPALGTKPPLLREHRIYQADFLLRFYGFGANELLTPERPNFNTYLDPKCEWAIRHLEHFPVEINSAGYQMLLRVPGIGVKSAQRICMARKSGRINFDGLKRIGVVLKRAHYFITCSGKMMYHTKIEEDYITRNIIDLDRKKNWQIEQNMTYKQLSLFEDTQNILIS